jgi:proteic killer suppression protein
VIQSFGDSATEDIFHGRDTRAARRLPRTIWPVIRRKLDMVNAAHILGDLASPPGNRLEALKGERSGTYSIRVNDQFRVVFRFEDGAAYDVTCEDYH